MSCVLELESLAMSVFEVVLRPEGAGLLDWRVRGLGDKYFLNARPSTFIASSATPAPGSYNMPRPELQPCQARDVIQADAQFPLRHAGGQAGGGRYKARSPPL